MAPAAANAVNRAEEDGVEEVKVVGLRRRIAERMQDAVRRIPHFAYVEEADVTELEALRRELNASSATRGRLTLLPFLIHALARSFAAHPGINAHFDDERNVIRRFHSVHAGIATQTDRGLLVPVVRHAERKDLWQLAAEIARLSETARSGKAKLEELTGSTITVTSLGALGGIASTPAPPASAPGGYMSAVSMKLIPTSAALSSIRCASFSSVCFPKVPVLRIMRETVRPV